MQYLGTGRIGLSQNVAYTTTAGVTTAIGGQTYKVRVAVTADAFVTTDGTTPSATNGAYVPAIPYVEYFTTTPGQQISAVQVVTSGTLYITEII
jgi:hypothetical protein